MFCYIDRIILITLIILLEIYFNEKKFSLIYQMLIYKIQYMCKILEGMRKKLISLIK